MSKDDALRQQVHKVRHSKGAGRIVALEDLERIVQRLRDEQLLALTAEPGGQTALARELGISRQAVSMRVQHARDRITHRQRDAR